MLTPSSSFESTQFSSIMFVLEQLSPIRTMRHSTPRAYFSIQSSYWAISISRNLVNNMQSTFTSCSSSLPYHFVPQGRSSSTSDLHIASSLKFENTQQTNNTQNLREHPSQGHAHHTFDIQNNRSGNLGFEFSSLLPSTSSSFPTIYAAPSSPHVRPLPTCGNLKDHIERMTVRLGPHAPSPLLSDMHRPGTGDIHPRESLSISNC